MLAPHPAEGDVAQAGGRSGAIQKSNHCCAAARVGGGRRLGAQALQQGHATGHQAARGSI